MKIYDIEKNGSVITFKGVPRTRENAYAYDFTTHKFTNKTSKKVLSRAPWEGHDFLETFDQENNQLDIMAWLLDMTSYRDNGICEDWFSVIDMFDVEGHCPLSFSILAKPIPKGYVKFCREYNFKINMSSFNIFQEQKNFSIIPKRVLEYIKNKLGHTNYQTFFNTMIEAGMTTKQHFLTLEKAIAIDFKNWHDPFNKYLYQQYVIIAEIISGKYEKKGFTWDTNRSLSQNMECFKMWNNRAQNECLAEWQKNFSSIEGTTFDFDGTTVKVIVPVDVAQLIDEGQQQNNCVGHYYNSGIANHRQVICFVRKAETPNHSFVTCRYDVSEKTFVEMRFKNNYDLTFAQKNIIRENLDNRFTEIIKSLQFLSLGALGRYLSALKFYQKLAETNKAGRKIISHVTKKSQEQFYENFVNEKILKLCLTKYLQKCIIIL